MDITILLLVAGALFFIGVFFLLSGILKRGIGLRERVLQDHQAEEEPAGLADRVSEVLIPLGKALQMSEGKRAKEQGRLVTAGFRNSNAIWIWYGAMIATGVVSFVGLTAIGLPFSNPLLGIMLPVILGMVLPDLWLRRRISRRKERIQLALPDMMDLAVVCVEAGMGLDQALQRIGWELKGPHPDLSDELHLYNLEVNAGWKRPDALRNLAARTAVDDVRSLVASLVQTDRFGTSIADSLRIFSDSLRVKRRQRAEEKAAKMSVKIVVPSSSSFFRPFLLLWQDRPSSGLSENSFRSWREPVRGVPGGRIS